jgi:hypothetical protein
VRQALLPHIRRRLRRRCYAVADREITRIEVADLYFPIRQMQEDFEDGQLPETLVKAQDAIVFGAALRHR